MRYPRIVPVAIFLLIAAITILSVFAIERGESNRAAAQLRNRATTIAVGLERRANASSAYLRAGAALLATVEDMPATRFRRFVSELRLDADYRGAEGIGWAQVVYPDEVSAFEQLMTEDASTKVRLHPSLAPGQPYSVPVTFIQPDTERNRRTLGFDQFSEKVRRRAMVDAERTASPTATDKVMLTQEDDGVPGFLIFMPVFEPTSEGRQLKGFIYSPFDAQEFLEAALEFEDINNQLSVRLYDSVSLEPEQLLASNGRSANDGKAIIEQLSIANNLWSLQVQSASKSALSVLSMATIIFGLMVGVLLMLLIRVLTKQALEDEAALRWFEEQASIRMSLTRELNHRVKNTLANVLSIIALTRRRTDRLDEFADALDGRIRALSATHDLLTQSEWGTTPIGAVIEAELLPYADEDDHKIDVRGPDIELAPNDALSLGLAMHELATNAAKYGALSKAGGKVSVNWRLISQSLVRIEWQESSGPPVQQQRRRGFGTDLLERVVAAELKSPVELDFNVDGVRCVLTIPVRQPSEFTMRANKLQQREASAEESLH